MTEARRRACAVLYAAHRELLDLAALSQDDVIGEASSSLLALDAFVGSGVEVFAPGFERLVPAVVDWLERVAAGDDSALQVDTKFGVVLGAVARPDHEGRFEVTIGGRA